jgi:aryl-alcohol dehydrogenase-like predicted oxidoreductase
MEQKMKRKLGRSGIEISALGMGCWAIGGPFWSEETPLGWGEVDDNESIKALILF